MKKYYKDFCGATASITTRRDGTAKLVIMAGGKRYSNTYKTERGARIAMSKQGDSWREV